MGNLSEDEDDDIKVFLSSSGQTDGLPPARNYARKRNSMILGLSMCCLCIVLPAVVVPSVLLTRPTETSPPISAPIDDDRPIITWPRGQPVSPPSPSPLPPSVKEGFEKVKELVLTELGNIPGIDLAVYEDITSPEYLALLWLSDTDTRKLDQSGNRRLRAGVSELVHRFLVANLHFSMGGDLWSDQDFWLTESDECGWFGVVCSIVDGAFSVTRIDLEGNILGGKLPQEIAGFPNLESLRLGNNLIGGSIPNTIQDSNLKNLELWTNKLTGSIPDAIGSMNSLESLYLFGNLLVGSLPDSLGSMTNLEDLSIYNNMLDGTIPNTITEFGKLKRFWATNNMFTGEFPAAVFNMDNIESLYLDTNFFEGAIVDIATRLPRLRDLRLDNNKFSGCPPFGLFRMSFLKILYLDKNELSCNLISQMYEGPVLEDLRLSKNNFYGNIPPVRSPSSLRILDLGSNVLRGSIPTSFSYLTEIEKLSLEDNKIGGNIPGELESLVSLQKLFLSNNNLKGTIPPDLFGKWDKMTQLHLENNDLTGPIPTSITGLFQIQDLRLDRNNLKGTIPPIICDYGSITKLTADCAGSVREVLCSCCTDCPP